MGSGPATTSHEVTGLTVGTLYYFQIQAGSPQGDSDASDHASARPVPVRGEWSFAATIKPDPLPSGSTATLDFTATYQVTGGAPTELAFDITDSDGGNSPNINIQLSNGDDGRVSLGDSFGTDTSVLPRNLDGDIICNQKIDATKGEIVCRFSKLVEVFTKTGATPGRFDVTVTLGNGLTFEAKASTSQHADFLSAIATADDMGEIVAVLDVEAGPPDAPTGLTATGGNSRANLAWDDPTNQNITGYEYQQTTTEPGITLTWTDPGDSTITKYQYRHTTTEPGIVISWPFALGKDRYEYRHSTVDGDFSGAQWLEVPPIFEVSGSPLMASSKITGLDVYIDHYFEVRAVVGGTPEAAVTPTQSVVNFESAAWTDIPESSDSTTSYKFTATDITGLDLRIPNYIEVAPFVAAVGDPVALGPQQIENFNGITDWTPLTHSGPVGGILSGSATGLTDDVRYYFRVQALTSGGGSGPSNTASATPVLVAPAKPSGFTAVPSDGVTEVILTWTAVGDATGWKYRYTSAWQAVLTWTADADAKGWEYRHSVDGGDNYGAWTDTGIIEADAATATTVTITGENLALGDWFEVRPVKAEGEQAAVTTGQTISGDFTGVEFTNIDPSGPTTTQHRVGGLDLNENEYDFEVQQVGGVNGGQSVTANVIHVGFITLTWDDPGDSTITKYQYHLKEGDTTVADWEDIPDSAPTERNAASYPVLDLKALVEVPSGDVVVLNDFVYTVKIRAVNNSGDMGTEAAGPETSEVKANPGLPLDAPTGVAASYDLATNTFTIRWDEHEIPGADFEVRATGPVGALRPVISEATTSGEETTAATSADIQSDLFGQFNFEVRARNNFGPWSETVTVSATASPFAEEGLTREVDDGAPAGPNVGKPVVVAATGYTVSYSLSGSGSGHFVIDPGTGQISLRGKAPTPGDYPVVVTARLSKDGASSQTSVDVTINVTTMDPWVQLAIHRPVDGAAGDEFGNSVAVDGETGVSVVGAPQVGNAAGAAYVYERPGDYSPAKLTASTPADNEKFGNSVAVDGDTVVVGTSGTDKVYVFTKTGASWVDSNTPAATLTGTASEVFGGSVAISDDTIFVGAKGTDASPGAVYVFVKPDGADWDDASTTDMGVTTLTALNGENGDGFGSRVAIEGNDLVVVGLGSQAVYYFAKSADGWATGTETAKLTATGDETGDWFGALSADIDSGTIVVGATQVQSSGEQTRSGAVYVFTDSGSAWEQVATLTALGGDAGDGFGKDVQISGDVIAAGRRNQADNDLASSVQVFKKASDEWDSSIVPSVLLASDGEAGDLFGHAVALDGKLMVVGALREDTRGDSAGAAYVFSSVTRPTVSGGVLEVVHPYSEPTVTRPNGITQVTIPGGAVPTGTGSFWRFVKFSGCTGVPGGTVHDCISVQLYDLDGILIPFGQDTQLDDEAEVTLSKPSRSFTVRKRSGTTDEIFECPDEGSTGECYEIVGNTIVVTGITSFSQYVVATTATRPSAPTGLQAVSGNRRVTLSWTAPGNQGTSAILRYQFSQDGGGTWNDVPGSDSNTTGYVVRRLSDGTLYSFAVRAVNSAGPGLTSNIVNARPKSTSRDSGGRARGGGSATAHVPPTFDEGASTARQIAENSPTGTRIGGPLVARDPLERRVLYTKGGPDADLFDVASQTGQIYVRRGTVLDYESGRKTFLIEVVGNTGVGGPAKIAVTIIVTNVPEPGSVVLSPDTPPEVGAEITAALSDPDSGINGVNWQWQRSSDGRTWNDIPGATSASYMPAEADRGMMLRVSVRYNDAVATGINLVSMATGAVPERTPVLDLPGSVTLSPEGAPEVGTEITATLTDPDGGVTGEIWQWQRSADGVTWTAIDGASTASYTPVEADVGMMLRANVSYSDAVAAGVSLVGVTTEAVAAMPAPDRPGTVTLSPGGTPQIGKAITATVTDPDGEVTGEIWQWQRSADGVTWTDIDGATTERYTPTESDAGMMLRANVSYNDAVATGVNAMGINTEAVAAGPAPDLETPTPTPTPPSPPVRPATPTPTPTLVVPPQTPTPTQTMLPTPPPTDVPPTPTAITSEVTPTEAPTTPVTPEEEGGFPAWLIIVIIIGAVIIIAGIIIIVRSRMQQ